MLHGEMPFGSWRESELDTFAKVAKGRLNLPETFSPKAVDLLTKVSLEPFSHFPLPLTLLIGFGGNIRIFHLVALNPLNDLFSYLKSMKTQDLEAKVLSLSSVIRGLMGLTGKGLWIELFLFLMKSPPEYHNI